MILPRPSPHLAATVGDKCGEGGGGINFTLRGTIRLAVVLGKAVRRGFRPPYLLFFQNDRKKGYLFPASRIFSCSLGTSGVLDLDRYDTSTY